MSKKQQKVIADTDPAPARRYLCATLMQQFRRHLRRNFDKNEPQIWIPVETSLFMRYEFATLTTHTRYIYIAILLYCGANGVDEIPLDTKFLANALAVSEKSLPNALEELKKAGLLAEREKEKKKEQTDRKKEKPAARVSVSDENFSKTKAEEKTANEKNAKTGASKFSLEECRRYVELEKKDGANIENPNALAIKLYNTGQSDTFIKARLYPEQAAEEQYGAPRKFTDQPCTVCYGAKQADIGGKGYGKCPHCRNEKNIATGFEPLADTS